MLYIIGIIAVLFGVALDQYTKHLATIYLQEKPIVIIKDVFQLQYLENRGAAFGMLQNQQTLFLFVSTIALILITVVYIRLPKERRYVPLRFCLISIVAGAIGNMIDRIRLQYVVDFFYFELIDFPIFNVADIFASVATVALIFLVLFYYKDEEFDVIFHTLKLKKEKTQE